MTDREARYCRERVRRAAPLGLTTQKEFNKNRPKICTITGCFVSMHALCDGTVHIRHNLSCFPVDDDVMDSLNLDIWGDFILPWLEAQHATSPKS